MSSRFKKTRTPRTERGADTSTKHSQSLNNASPARASISRLKVATSRIHGRGVFAAQPFRKGERIIEYTGRRIRWSSVPDELDDPRMYYFGIGDGEWVIDPSVDGNEARWINHSCDPNCEIRETRRRIFIHALRNIRSGEELFYDYHLETDDDVPVTKEIESEAPCRCGSANCRGTLLARKSKKDAALRESTSWEV